MALCHRISTGLRDTKVTRILFVGAFIAGASGNTIIDTSGRTTGLLAEASGVSVRGLTVEGANHEGILAGPPVGSCTRRCCTICPARRQTCPL
jgi:hypothetical protein